MRQSLPQQSHSHSHGPAYHDPEGFQPYVPNDLLVYVEHGAGVAINQPLDSMWLLNNLPAGYLPPTVNEGTLISLPAAHFSPLNYQVGNAQKMAVQAQPAATAQAAGSSYTLFCIRTDDLNVAELYKNFYEPQFQALGLKAAQVQAQQSQGQPIGPLNIQLNNNQGTIQHVFPNWYSGAAPHTGIGSHGPGGPPRPVLDPDSVENLRFEYTDKRAQGKNTFKAEISSVVPHAADEKVVVYILDTLPPLCRIQYALCIWKKLAKHFKDILTPIETPKFKEPHVYETKKATYHYVGATGQNFDALKKMPKPDSEHTDYAVGSHHYDSSDHGLFVAGIVHMIAPTVPLHIIQVMGDYGVGTLMNFAAGLSRVADIHQKYHAGSQIIVNCSFTLAIPMNEQNDPVPEYDLQVYEQQHPGFRAQMDTFSTALQTILGLGAVVLAAAGNDSVRVSRPSIEREARYPAQLLSVYGVGALKNDLRTTADYSNNADNPTDQGVLILGGDYENLAACILNAHGYSDYVDSGNGLISIFTGNLNLEMAHLNRGCWKVLFSLLSFLRFWLLRLLVFLRILPRAIIKPAAGAFINPTGYAEWKGTSFATPVVVGVIAQWCAVKSMTANVARQEVYAYGTSANPNDPLILDIIFQTRS